MAKRIKYYYFLYSTVIVCFREVVSMIKFIIMSLVICLCFGLCISQPFAADDAATAQKLVNAVKGDHQHAKYYTGKHGYVNEDVAGPLEKGFYIMSWLVLDPPIKVAGTGGAAFIAKDLYNEYNGIPEEKVSADKKNWPVAGQVLKKKNNANEDMTWIPINFMDLVDAGQGGFASGNEFDWAEWGGQGLSNFHEYLFTLAKWSKGGEITFKAGSDDPEQTWVNGQKVCEGLADRDWGKDSDVGKATVKAGEFVAILAEVGENGGECGYTLRCEPPPDDGTLNVATIMLVASKGKMPVLWGYIKSSY